MPYGYTDTEHHAYLDIKHAQARLTLDLGTTAGDLCIFVAK